MKLLFSIIELILEENTILTLIRIKSFQIQIYPIRLLTTKTFLRKIRCVKIPNLPHQKRNINIDYSIIR